MMGREGPRDVKNSSRFLAWVTVLLHPLTGRARVWSRECEGQDEVEVSKEASNRQSEAVGRGKG